MRTVVLVAALFCATIPIAHASSLERLGDGRVVVQVLGERLAFRDLDAGRVGLNWPSYRCDPKPKGSTTLEL